MEKLTELTKALTEVDDKIDQLLSAEELTDEQRAQHDALTAERKKLVSAITKEKDRLDREGERLELEAAAAQTKRLADERKKRQDAAAQGARITGPDTPGGLPTGLATQLPRTIITSDDLPAKIPLRIPAAARRTVPLRFFKGRKNGMDAEERAYRFGMWCMGVMSRCIGPWNNRPAFAPAVDFLDRMGAAVQENDNTGYQYLIPEEFGMDIIDLRERFGVARRVLKVLPMATDTRVDPRRQSGLTAYFPGEGGAGTESNKVWNQVRLVAKDAMVLSRYTNQVRLDAAINVGDDLAGEIAYAYTNLEDKCAFIGDGTSTYAGILGVIKKMDNCDGLGGASAGRVNAAATGSWGAIVLADFNKLIGTLPQFAASENCCFVCSRQFYFTVMQKLLFAAGGTQPWQMAAGDPDTGPVVLLFLGYPVKFSQVYPIVTAATGVMVTFGDHAMAGTFGDRQQDSIAFSEHATIGGQNVFERNEVAIRGMERFDINIHDVGSTTVAGPVVGLATG